MISEKRGEERMLGEDDKEEEEDEWMPREESVMKDWIDSLASLTRNLSLASPFGGGSTAVSTMSTVSTLPSSSSATVSIVKKPNK